MRLWKRAAGLLKDRNSILVASLVRRTPHRHPEVEAAVIKATSHDESSVDYDSARLVFRYINMSPAYLRAFVWALCMRIEKTRSWVVALKGVILMHGVLSCEAESVRTIGRLPFDLSNFKDGHGRLAKMWGFNAFVRAYYAYLDQKSALIFANFQERKVRSKLNIREQDREKPLLRSLVWLQNLQGLLDMLLEIKPLPNATVRALILEAMDNAVVDIYSIYSMICGGIAKALVRIYSAGKTEASMALKILHKSSAQAGELSLYFDLCREIGVRNAKTFPKVQKVPDEDFRELERIISGVSDEKFDTDMAIVAREASFVDDQKDSRGNLQTVITNDWEVFDEDLIKIDEEIDSDIGKGTNAKQDPFVGPLVPFVHTYGGKHQELPDLISFS